MLSHQIRNPVEQVELVHPELPPVRITVRLHPGDPTLPPRLEVDAPGFVDVLSEFRGDPWQRLCFGGQTAYYRARAAESGLNGRWPYVDVEATRSWSIVWKTLTPQPGGRTRLVRPRRAV